MLAHKSHFRWTAVAMIAVTLPAHASEWNYGCKGALPVFEGSEIIIFNREFLFLLPKTWLKGSLRELLARAASDEVISVAMAVDINSGLAPEMVFRLQNNPDKKLTLTEASSKTVSDVRERAAGPRLAQTTTYTKLYHYVSDFGYLGPFDVKMDCINYQLSAPIR